MSYLDPVRLIFSGRFQADVATVNNNVRHYASSEFEPVYQEELDNVSWNPKGSNAFRLIDCKVQAAHYADGTACTNPAMDPIVGVSVLNANQRSSAKIVDLDPQWQLASELWGLQVRLVRIEDSQPHEFLCSEYKPNPFRDIWFNRVTIDPKVQIQPSPKTGSSVFQSVLTDLLWTAAYKQSRFLKELRAGTKANKLSIRLVTFGYNNDPKSPGFTFGRILGVIGPYYSGEPESFVVGRRFSPSNRSPSNGGFTFTAGKIVRGNRLLVDLGNSIPLNGRYQPLSLQKLHIGALLDPTLQQGDSVSDKTFQDFGTVPYSATDWLEKTSGIAEFQLNSTHLRRQKSDQYAPLALVLKRKGSKSGVIALRETENGLFVGAEPFVFRIDTQRKEPVSAECKFYASRYGEPASRVVIKVSQSGKIPNMNGVEGGKQPPVPVPFIGTPTRALSFPETVATNKHGVALLTLNAHNPGTPRDYIQGQIYNLTYLQEGQSISDFSKLEVIAVGLRTAYAVPKTPTWSRHIKPIFTLYANLYPVMSKLMFNLSDPAAVLANRKLLQFAFSRKIHDPNYMPATRDLPEGKRQTIVNWLANLDRDKEFQRLASQGTPSPAVRLDQKFEKLVEDYLIESVPKHSKVLFIERLPNHREELTLKEK